MYRRGPLGSGLFNICLLLLVACGGKGETQEPSATPGSGGTTFVNGAAGNSAAGAPRREGPIGCTNPVAHVNESTGFESCDGSFMHRPWRGACPLHPPSSESRYSDASPCQSDTDCANIERGHCVYRPGIGVGCDSECAADSDCPTGQVCLCDSEFNRCVYSDCTTDADCGSGLLCASHSSNCSPSVVGGFACQTPKDTCTTDASCVGLEYQFRVCAPSTGARDCLGAGACAGK